MRIKTHVTNGQTGETWVEVTPDLRPMNEQRASRKAEARAFASGQIETVWPSWKQVNAAMGIYGDAGKTSCAQHIATWRAWVDQIDVLIDAASDSNALWDLEFT